MAEVGNYDLRDSYGETVTWVGLQLHLGCDAIDVASRQEGQVDVPEQEEAAREVLRPSPLNSTSPYLGLIAAQPHRVARGR